MLALVLKIPLHLLEDHSNYLCPLPLPFPHFRFPFIAKTCIGDEVVLKSFISLKYFASLKSDSHLQKKIICFKIDMIVLQK